MAPNARPAPCRVESKAPSQQPSQGNAGLSESGRPVQEHFGLPSGRQLGSSLGPMPASHATDSAPR